MIVLRLSMIDLCSNLLYIGISVCLEYLAATILSVIANIQNHNSKPLPGRSPGEFNIFNKLIISTILHFLQNFLNEVSDTM